MRGDSHSSIFKTVLADELRFLTFRPVSASIHTHWKVYLAFGLFFTWLAGIGRYWDNPKAQLWQYLGLGSLAYVFVLAAIVFLLVLPLGPKNWSYRNVLLFITLTSPPAVLYAIPVETFMTPGAARSTNAWFLAIVATWRVGLYSSFLRTISGLTPAATIVATLLPLAIIVIALSMLNLDHVVFDMMSGTKAEDRSQNDAAYGVVVMLSLLSFISAPFLAIGYLTLIARSISRQDPHDDNGWRRGEISLYDNAPAMRDVRPECSEATRGTTKKAETE